MLMRRNKEKNTKSKYIDITDEYFKNILDTPDSNV